MQTKTVFWNELHCYSPVLSTLIIRQIEKTTFYFLFCFNLNVAFIRSFLNQMFSYICILSEGGLYLFSYSSNLRVSTQRKSAYWTPRRLRSALIKSERTERKRTGNFTGMNILIINEQAVCVHGYTGINCSCLYKQTLIWNKCENTYSNRNIVESAGK